jgi:hypothetical protein
VKPFISAVSASLLATGTLAQPATTLPSIIIAAPNAVAAIVKIPKPWYAPKSLVISKMQATVPQYEQLSGLHYKIFTLTQPDAQFGGIYLWRDRITAQNWFNSAWHERVRKTYGSEPKIEWFDAPIAITSKLTDNQLEGNKP